jgi:hypothetical protein
VSAERPFSIAVLVRTEAIWEESGHRQARNGRRATLLLDTGAALSTFSIKTLPAMDTDHRITMNLGKRKCVGFRRPSRIHCSFRRNIVVSDFKFGDADGVTVLDILSSFKTILEDR